MLASLILLAAMSGPASAVPMPVPTSASGPIGSAPVQAPAPDPLQPLGFLVGHCWAGDFAHGMGRDTHCFEPMFGGKFIRDRHVLHGKHGDYRGETIYGYDAAKKQIIYWYFSSDGDIDNSSVLPVAQGFLFPERQMPQAPNMTMRTRWNRSGDDRYVAINERKGSDGHWQTLWSVEYVRQPGAATPAPNDERSRP